VDRGTFNLKHAPEFHEALLDALALQHVTGDLRNVFSRFKTNSAGIAALGRKKGRLAKLTDGETSQLDWHFQLLIQAWACSKGLGPLRDLRDEACFAGRKVCDFAITYGNGAIELLECKRVHPGAATTEDVIPVVVSKIRDKLPKAAAQLNETALVIGNAVRCRHVLIDISAYCNEARDVPSRFGHVQAVGFDQDRVDHVLSVIASDIKEHHRIIDKVTLCWRTLVLIDDKVRALVHNPVSRLCSSADANPGFFEYGGWTVEGYPISTEDYCEFRVSNTVRSIDWIDYSCYMCSNPEKVVKVGPWESA
jgi:hypothetical protein